jgi:hypothetical protein
MTEEQNRAALLHALQEKIAAKEAAAKNGSRIDTVDPTAATKPTADPLPPELKILADRRARYDLGDRSVRREVFGRQEQTTAKGVDDWNVF